jgi:hypothetical protein
LPDGAGQRGVGIGRWNENGWCGHSVYRGEKQPAIIA